MKKALFIIILCPIILWSQNDTIFKINGRTIPCTITLVNEGAVFFKDKKNYGDQIPISEVRLYSQSGTRKEPITKEDSYFRYAEYNMSAFGEKFEIHVEVCTNEIMNYYIHTCSVDKISNKTALTLNELELKTFLNYLTTISRNYANWTEIAIKNDVQNYSKKGSESTISLPGAFYLGKWHFDKSIELHSLFNVTDSKSTISIISDEITTNDNQFMSNKGLSFIFSNTTEIENLINLMDRKTILDFYYNKKKLDALFK
ncbi:MAG: hypothetical protein V4580_05195 [Bacteroidota bacterium]